MILIAIQVGVESKEWSDSLPVIHEVESAAEGLLIAKAIAKQLGNPTKSVTPLRVTWPSASRIAECTSQIEIEDYISRLSGQYPYYF